GVKGLMAGSWFIHAEDMRRGFVGFNLVALAVLIVFLFSSRRRHTRSKRDWSADVCSSDLLNQRRQPRGRAGPGLGHRQAKINQQNTAAYDQRIPAQPPHKRQQGQQRQGGADHHQPRGNDLGRRQQEKPQRLQNNQSDQGPAAGLHTHQTGPPSPAATLATRLPSARHRKRSSSSSGRSPSSPARWLGP